MSKRIGRPVKLNGYEGRDRIQVAYELTPETKRRLANIAAADGSSMSRTAERLIVAGCDYDEQLRKSRSRVLKAAAHEAAGNGAMT